MTTSNPVPFLMQGKNIILVVDGKSHTISKDTHLSYSKIVDALKAKDWDALRDLVEPKIAIVSFGKGYISIVGNKLLWKDQPASAEFLAARIVEMYSEGFPIEPMINFMENLMQNPSKRSVDQLYKFLEKNSLPITEDGYFLAYKRVREDYKDLHTGTIDNSVGMVPTVERNSVDDNPDSYCSFGLHFCSLEYLDGFGSRNQPVMILKINPADVVSIPNDHDGAKGRCCKYEVVAQVVGDPADAFSTIVDNHYTCNDSIEHMDDDEPQFNEEQSEEQMYNLVRVHGYGGFANATVTEYYHMTYDEACEQIQKNISQKKAQLKMVPV